MLNTIQAVDIERLSTTLRRQNQLFLPNLTESEILDLIERSDLSPSQIEIHLRKLRVA